MTGCCSNLDMCCRDGLGEIFSKGAIFAFTFLGAPMGLIEAPWWAIRTTAPAEMILWGYSALVWKA